MKTIKFISSWSNFDQNTWSGTPYGILNALSTKANVEFMNVAPKRHNGVFQKIKDVIVSLNAGLPNLKYGTKKLDKFSSIDKDTPYIVFSEYNCKNIKNLYCYQDLSIDFLLRNGRIEAIQPFFRRLVRKNYEKKCKIALAFYQNCAGIFTMSEWLKKDLIEQTKISPEKIHVVGGGSNVDTSKIDYSKKEGNKFIFVGRDWERKNGDLVVKAFEILHKKNPNVHLYIAGPEICPKIITQQKNIHFLGKLSTNELYEYYNLCDYFVMPSKFEAYGLVFVEALSFGLPCIGRNCYAMPEFIKDGETGYLIQESDETELAKKMQQLLANGKPMSALLQGKREYYIKQYSWDSVAERIIDVLRKDGYSL